MMVFLVCVCVFFFLTWQKLQHSQCLAVCEDYSDVWPSERCAPMMVAEIQQCLAVAYCIYDIPWLSVCCLGVCAQL